jgi:hypothetical protein
MTIPLAHTLIIAALASLPAYWLLSQCAAWNRRRRRHKSGRAWRGALVRGDRG